MSTAILVRKSDKAVVGTMIDTATARWVADPEDPRRRLASPAEIGWENDDYKLVAFTPATVPDGKQATGDPVRVLSSDGTVVLETIPVEDVPAPTTLTAAQKFAKMLAVFDLTAAEFAAVLAAATKQ